MSSVSKRELLDIANAANDFVAKLMAAVDREGPGGKRVTREELGDVIASGQRLAGALLGLVTPWG